MPPQAKLNAESFVGLVKQSNLIDPDVLKAAWDDVGGRGYDPADARPVADDFVARKLLTRWQADKLLQRKHKGFFLGKYRLLSHLGSGGMSAVYLAEHVLMRRRVAIKVLPQARVADTSYLQRFHREAQAVAALDHRNIVRAYDVDQEGNVHFLVMEYVPGKSLHDLVSSEGRLSCIRAVEYIRQAAEGLQHAHRMGMVHRDIKPGNLLIDEKGTIKLLDLGLARFFDDKDENSLTIQHDEKVLGTADFLSPEQALDSHKVDIRSDIYSLGCTLYFLLAAQPPYPDGTLAQRLLAHQNKEPEPLANIRSDIPESLVAVIQRMMAKSPDSRFQTARETAAALLQWLYENGGVEWEKMNPVVPGSGQPTGSKPSSNVLESDTVAQGRPSGAQATEVGPGNSGSPSVAGRPQGTDAAASPSAGRPPSEPELAAFLSQLAAGDADSDSPPPPTTPPAAVERRSRASADLDLAPTTVVPKSKDSLGAAPPAPPRAREETLVNATTAAPIAKMRAPTDVRQDQRPAATSARAASPPEFSAAPADLTRFKPLSGRIRAPGRPAAAKSSSNVPAPVVSGKRNRRLIWGSATGALVVLGIAGYLASGRGKPAVKNANSKAKTSGTTASDTKKKAPPLRRELFVGPSAAFKTIGAALADAKENGNDSRKATQIIKVAAGHTYAERIVIDESFPRGIQIVADEGSPAILAPPGDEPIVVVNGGGDQLEGFRLEGFHLHAAGKEVAIQLSSWTPAAKLKRLRISGFKGSGVLLDGTQTFGAENDRIILEDLTFREASPEAVGVRFQRKAEDPMHLRLQQCRFLAPLAAGISLGSGAIDVEILESIFFRTRVGIRFDGADRTWRDIVMAFNTFYETERGVVLSQMPGAASSGFGVYNNLFVGTQNADAIVEKDYNASVLFSMFRTTPGGASYNWTTRPRVEPFPPEQLSFLFENVNGRFAAIDVSFQSLDPDTASFLAPTVESPQRHVGTQLDRKKFSDQIGAVRAK